MDSKQNNGNTQLNQIRNEFNDRVKSKAILGRSPRVMLNDKRRYRSI
jgi:hypothetical protein